ncbi:HesA/moeB/thiF family protein [Heterostelium album PN500]|uniref:HesA/moeB/thiF family protein n=1 Tax=Heterostelium pallidum (strain ATCC 26659 / Pp 5 / PN500) TaxID=670386 RepID=D3BL02_HETP5|nr:HesA/moeB/thiF family protein [Heterostelium album PN500]EFA78582.1 HesA/moeB/thiF family protein [Heterostelium album PN500]|eukprot:XP_020430706.1 HesA/moeB/thiF family protein [Heterostelium album PN500]
MDNKLFIAALGAGIGAAATYISTKVSSTKKRKSDFTSDVQFDNDTTMADDNDDNDVKPIDGHTSLLASADPFAKDKLNLSSMLEQEIFDEQMNRTMLYYGENGFKKLRESFVIVVGLGGVGGAAAHVLLRSGVKKIRLIDPDLVTISSLNRNVLAARKDVGRSKVETMKSYFNAICPEVEVEAIQTFFSAEVADTLLGGNPTIGIL